MVDETRKPDQDPIDGDKYADVIDEESLMRDDEEIVATDESDQPLDAVSEQLGDVSELGGSEEDDFIFEDDLGLDYDEDALNTRLEEIEISDTSAAVGNNRMDTTRDYPMQEEPEWKLAARQLREERAAKHREMIEKRREEDKRVVAERKQRMQEREARRREQEERFKERWKSQKAQKEKAVQDMMQRIRDEREARAKERAEFEGREGQRRFTYPKPKQVEPYPKPSELRRMQEEQPKSDAQPSLKPEIPEESEPSDIDSRISRLSKPADEPDSADAEGDAPENEG